jgi:hypothetical protein
MIKEQITIKGQITATIKDSKTGKIKRVYKHTNLITTAGRAVLAMLLTGDTTYSGEINYGALGTGTTAPANSDTKLETEVYRNQTASSAFDDNIAYITFFYTADETDGTYKEFGCFIDGAAGADTGQLFNHVAVDWTKTDTETLTVDCIFTLS